MWLDEPQFKTGSNFGGRFVNVIGRYDLPTLDFSRPADSDPNAICDNLRLSSRDEIYSSSSER